MFHNFFQCTLRGFNVNFQLENMPDYTVYGYDNHGEPQYILDLNERTQYINVNKFFKRHKMKLTSMNKKKLLTKIASQFDPGSLEVEEGYEPSGTGLWYYVVDQLYVCLDAIYHILNVVRSEEILTDNQ